MSRCMDIAATPGQLCYIPCNFCNIVLVVSVPCSSLLDIVTIRCGHCANLWSVNMAAAFHSLSSSSSSLLWHDLNNNYQAPRQDYRIDIASTSKSKNKIAARATKINDERVVKRSPEKRQRVPSAYNQFIKEEIQRIKANKPEISHREAFSTAAKNSSEKLLMSRAALFK